MSGGAARHGAGGPDGQAEGGEDGDRGEDPAAGRDAGRVRVGEVAAAAGEGNTRGGIGVAGGGNKGGT